MPAQDKLRELADAITAIDTHYETPHEEISKRKAAAWDAFVALRDTLTSTPDAETAHRERDEAVDIALWLAALDRVPIEERTEWVSTLRDRYEEIRAIRALDAAAIAAGVTDETVLAALNEEDDT
jgi:hypothetical protein